MPVWTAIDWNRRDCRLFFGRVDRYYRAIYLVYGGNNKELEKFRKKVMQQVQKPEGDQIALQDICLYWHQSSGGRAIKTPWCPSEKPWPADAYRWCCDKAARMANTSSFGFFNREVAWMLGKICSPALTDNEVEAIVVFSGELPYRKRA